MSIEDIKGKLLEGLTDAQKEALVSDKQKMLLIAGAGSGKTETMARKVAWWIIVKEVCKTDIVAFTFTERAAQELKFRIRGWLKEISPPHEEITLGDMYVGTIHGFCLDKLRKHWPDEYHNYDILAEDARVSLIMREFNGALQLKNLQNAMEPSRSGYPAGRYSAIDLFIETYDLLNENFLFEPELPLLDMPHELGKPESEWCSHAKILTNVGSGEIPKAFAESAARYYAYLRCRRFLDFSTSQSEFIRRWKSDSGSKKCFNVLVDEVQDINNVQRQLIDLLTGENGRLAMVGDHRQSIYAFRGSNIKIIADFWRKFQEDPAAQIVDMKENFRSTPRIIALANEWAKTIKNVNGMSVEDMIQDAGSGRVDNHPSHVAVIKFDDRKKEAEWIAKAINILIPNNSDESVKHDKRNKREYRGICLSDVAVLVRSSTDVRDYMQALEYQGISCVARAGPDLFSQPEILLYVSVLAMTAGKGFMGSLIRHYSLPRRIKDTFGDIPSDDVFDPEKVYTWAVKFIRNKGLPFGEDTEANLLKAAKCLHMRIVEGKITQKEDAKIFKCRELRQFLTSKHDLRRIFPQKIFHMLMEEGKVEQWDTDDGRGKSAMFHLGALSKLVTSVETPGWTSATDYPYHIIGLCQYGERKGRTEEQPLMAGPDAVNIMTIHAAKGLEFPAVFLADVNAQRFPSSKAKMKPKLAVDGEICTQMNVDDLGDNDNNDQERRLMYVAITRAERFLFISSNSKNFSRFFRELSILIENVGGRYSINGKIILEELEYSDKEHIPNNDLATSFSDLRYYFECPHDFYLRKVLGFSPTIDQAFGYGRAVHNLMREVHVDPKKWTQIAKKSKGALIAEIEKLIAKGLFYLRYTTGEPAINMRKKGCEIVADYIAHYIEEMESTSFEPEKSFETLISYPDGKGEGALVSGAIDIVRKDNPPRVTLIDFKSGHVDSDKKKLDQEQMKRQIGIYAIAAKKEMQYSPEQEQGLVRYLGEKQGSPDAELKIPLDDKSIDEVREDVSQAISNIRDRKFNHGPSKQYAGRCHSCDFVGFCGKKKLE